MQPDRQVQPVDVDASPDWVDYQAHPGSAQTEVAIRALVFGSTSDKTVGSVAGVAARLLLEDVGVTGQENRAKAPKKLDDCFALLAAHGRLMNSWYAMQC